jgi:1-deoxy-D-xylulose-5-phosphate reductoisomerase
VRAVPSGARRGRQRRRRRAPAALLRAAGVNTEVEHGEAALCAIASAPEVDSVMAAIVGAAGLAPTLAAARAGKKVLLANKEALVMSGQLFIDAAHEAGAVLLPIDSEHNAIFQCMPHSGGRGPARAGSRRGQDAADRIGRAVPARATSRRWTR